MRAIRSIPMALLVALMVVVSTAVGVSADGHEETPPITLTPLGTYATGLFDQEAAEIIAFDPETQRAFVVNGGAKTVDILDMRNVTAPTLAGQIDITQFGGGANSVAFRDGVLAAAVQAKDKQANGSIVFFDADGQLIASVKVGALPDMVIFTPDGTKVLSANEGEPRADYTNDPEGSVTIVDISGGVENVTQGNVTTADFSAFNDIELDPAIRIFGPGSTVAQDLEPEYIAVAPNSSTAYVTLQENNAFAIVDLTAGEVTDIVPLGFKDHSAPQVSSKLFEFSGLNFAMPVFKGRGLDASNKDDAINIQHWPVRGMYQPDTIVAYEVDGETYLITANEGDARDYAGYSEEVRVEDLTLDPAVFPNADGLQKEESLGRLKTTTASGDADGDGFFEEIYAFGGRSFSIWDTAGNLVFDSGDEIARITGEALPHGFNSSGENDTFDDRSDDKGAEPEALAIGVIDGVPYAFLGLERIGGIMVYDVSDPHVPVFVQYVNNRNFGVASEKTGDLAPEGIIVVSAENSPTGAPLLMVANEFSGTVTVYAIGR